MRYVVKREIFASLSAIDSRMALWSQRNRDLFVFQLFQDTKKILSTGMNIPVVEGHDDSNERLRGRLIDVDIDFKRDPSEHFVITGEMQLSDEIYEAMQKGELPDVSVEIADSADLSAFSGQENDTIGGYFYRVALLGSTPPGMPFLKGAHDNYFASFRGGDASKIDSVMAKALQNENKLIEMYKKKESSMEKEIKDPMMKKVMAAIMSALSGIFPDGKDKDNDDGPPPKEDLECKDDNKKMKPKRGFKTKEDSMGEKSEKEEKKDVIKEVGGDEMKNKDYSVSKDEFEKLKAENASLRKFSADTAFSSLQNMGKVSKDQKEKFMRIVDDIGIDFAVETFSLNPGVEGMTTTILGDESLNQGWEEKAKKEWTDKFSAFATDEKELEFMVTSKIDELKKQKEESNG